MLSLNNSVNQDSCGSLWFNKFVRSCHNRMGDQPRRNKGLSMKLLKRVLRAIEANIRSSTSLSLKHSWYVLSCYIAVCYVISLRGNEGFLLDLTGLHQKWNKQKDNYFILALRGKLKGEHHWLAHLIPCVKVTVSKIPIKDIVKRVMTQADFELVSSLPWKLVRSHRSESSRRLGLRSLLQKFCFRMTRLNFLCERKRRKNNPLKSKKFFRFRGQDPWMKEPNSPQKSVQ